MFAAPQTFVSYAGFCGFTEPSEFACGLDPLEALQGRQAGEGGELFVADPIAVAALRETLNNSLCQKSRR